MYSARMTAYCIFEVHSNNSVDRCHAIEPLYSSSAVIASWLQSTSAQTVYLAINKGTILVIFFTSENIHQELLSLINPAGYLLNKIVYGLSDSCYSAIVMPKICFFLKKRMKESFAYVLEFMLTFDKMQNTIPFMCTKFEI